LIVGSSGSRLALAQSEELLGMLRSILPDLDLALVRIGAHGDHDGTSAIARTGGQGVVARRLEEALLRGVIDVAVHSLRDAPGELAPGLHLAAVPQRRDPREAVITASGERLEQLPAGSRIGAGSLRRALQLRAFRPDLKARAITGNFDSRVKKIRSGELDGLIISAAAVERMGWQDRVAEHLPVETFLPAACQGALAVMVKAANAADAVMPLVNDEASEQATAAERAFMRTLGDRCRSAAAALAHMANGSLYLEGMVGGTTSGKVVRARLSGSARAPEVLGERVARRVMEVGGWELIEESKLLAVL
jgi:hydroxymethylbilane synthase